MNAKENNGNLNVSKFGRVKILDFLWCLSSVRSLLLVRIILGDGRNSERSDSYLDELKRFVVMINDLKFMHIFSSCRVFGSIISWNLTLTFTCLGLNMQKKKYTSLCSFWRIGGITGMSLYLVCVSISSTFLQLWSIYW